MLLDSARDLKNRMISGLTAVVATASAVRAMGIRAQVSAPNRDAMRAIAVGICMKGTQHRLAVRIQRRSLQSHPMVTEMREMAKGEIDVRFIGKIQKMESPGTLQRRRRPLVTGCSIGHHRITAGTLGCFVVDRNTGEKWILSNNHVLANENSATAGDKILQPGKLDGGTISKDWIGRLERFVRLKKRAVNFVDCAVCSVKNGVKIRNVRLGTFGNLAGLGPAVVQDEMSVHKIGRTTGQTDGTVTAFELDNVVVEYDLGNLRFDDQIEIEGAGASAFSDGGDSGSLIVNDACEAVALLFAGGDSGGSNGMGLTYANPIRPVLGALQVDLAS